MRPIGLKLAMKIGGEYALRNIAARHWRRLAAETHLNPDELLATLRSTALAMPENVVTIREQSKREGLVHPIMDRLSEELIARARECQRRLK
jgi:serine/threonine-protein kinase HipA